MPSKYPEKQGTIHLIHNNYCKDTCTYKYVQLALGSIRAYRYVSFPRNARTRRAIHIKKYLLLTTRIQKRENYLRFSDPVKCIQYFKHLETADINFK